METIAGKIRFTEMKFRDFCFQCVFHTVGHYRAVLSGFRRIGQLINAAFAIPVRSEEGVIIPFLLDNNGLLAEHGAQVIPYGIGDVSTTARLTVTNVSIQMAFHLLRKVNNALARCRRDILCT